MRNRRRAKAKGRVIMEQVKSTEGGQNEKWGLEKCTTLLVHVFSMPILMPALIRVCVCRRVVSSAT